jgi:glucoamylase
MDKASLDLLREAPSQPGAAARWARSDKMAVGTSRSVTSMVWFTIGRGTLTEVFYPRLDSPCTRDVFLIVTGPDGYFSDEREDAVHQAEWLGNGLPGVQVTTSCRFGQYRIVKTFITDDRLSTVLQRTRIEFFKGNASQYRVYLYANPHMSGEGSANCGWIGDYKGSPMLFANRDELAMAIGCSTGFSTASAGYLEQSDGLADLKKFGHLRKIYHRAGRGSVGLVGEIELGLSDEFTIALGFGVGASEAAHHTRGGLNRDFEDAKTLYLDRWKVWQSDLEKLDDAGFDGIEHYRTGTAVLLVHANKSTPGAVASLVTPWGHERGDENQSEGAYHMVWTRDLSNHASGLLAAGDTEQTGQLIPYLGITQEPEGHWPQCMRVSGQAFKSGVQMDEVASPILIADLALLKGAIDEKEQFRHWPMVRQAAAYIVQHGPWTEMDRWEEEDGYNAYTIGTCIAALLTAAEWAEVVKESAAAIFLREVADSWNACIEGWLYVTDTDLAKKLEIDGYYARTLDAKSLKPPLPGQRQASIVGEPRTKDKLRSTEVVSVDALALVRLGLRRADDPRITNTVKAIDALLKLETERGPIWHRYNGDQFGEGEKGRAFSSDRNGIGRVWPLLIGERGHYELARGDLDAAKRLLKSMANYASETGLFPEQVWDADDIPEMNLYRGKPTGSAMPLVWAHGEYIKLIRSIRDKAIFDQPRVTTERYAEGVSSSIAVWRPNCPFDSVSEGMTLRIIAPANTEVAWRANGGEWTSSREGTRVLGLTALDIKHEELPVGASIQIEVTNLADDVSRRDYSLFVRCGL